MITAAVLHLLHPMRWYPVGFVATSILLAFSATPNPLFALWRPLLVAVGMTVGLQLLVWGVMRNGDRAALVTAILLLAILAIWVPLVVVVTASAWLFLVGWLRRRAGEPDLWLRDRMTPFLAVFAWSLAGVAAGPVVLSELSDMAARNTVPGSTPFDPDRSDVVIILLDAYPRGDSQTEQFEIDPREFEGELAARGFTVAHQARSNYTSTWMTLTSMTHGRYVDEIDGLATAPDSKVEHYRRLMRAIKDAPLFAELRHVGYEIVTIPPPIESATLTAADRLLLPGQLTSFELSLLQHSLIGLGVLDMIPELAFDQHRSRIEASLELAYAEMRAPSDDHRLVFVHLLTPHAPIVYSVDGGSAEPAACFPFCSLYVMDGDADWNRYPEQLASVNDMLLHAVDRIRAASADATIILMSDHGSVRTGADRVNVFRSFFAASVPDASITFPNDVSPIDVLRLIADPQASPTTPYRAWISAPEEPMNVTPFDAALP